MPSRGACIPSRIARTTSTATSTTRTSARRSATSARFIASQNTKKDMCSTAPSCLQKIRETVELGGDQILMQGGLHPDFKLEWYEELLCDIKRAFPQVNIHGFSPPEIHHFTKVSKLPLRTVLERLKAAGLGQSSRRRGRDSGRSRAPRDHARQGDDRRLAECASRMARAGGHQHRHHDVRPYRDAGRTDRAPGTATAASGRNAAVLRPSSVGRFSRSTRTWQTFRPPARSTI